MTVSPTALAGMTASKFPAAGHEPSLAELMDPAILARRLEEARARRNVALAARDNAAASTARAEPRSERSPAPSAASHGTLPAPPPLPEVLHAPAPDAVPAAEPPARATRPAWWLPLLVGLAAMAATALGLIALLKPTAPEAWQGVSGIAMPDPGRTVPSPFAATALGSGSAAPETVVAVAREVPAAALGPAPLRPRARPDDLVPVQIVQTERRRAAADSAELARTLSRVNQKTLGAMAEALGIRRSIELPDGKRITIDRRGLRLRP